jgi:GT2 family glycosyltransferase/glycosyltransferase involved in cell wall biosynthesis
VTVISILTMNNLPLLKQCLASILEHTCGEYRVCVFNQGSTDGTREYLDELRPRVDAIHSPANVGFIVGNNRIMDAYPDDDVVLLNDDTIVKAGWLEALASCARSTPEIGIVGAKLLYPDGRLQEAGGEIFQDGSGRNIGKYDDTKRHIYCIRRDADYCSGACLFIKREVLNRIGYLDEIFSPAYWEDTDLCFRARKAGYRVVYEPAAEVIHFEGATGGSPDCKSLSRSLQDRNKPKFMARWGEELKNHRTNVFDIRTSGDKEKLLVILPFLPMYDRAAGEKRWFHTLKILKKHFEVVLLARNGLDQLKYINAVEEMGITVFHTDQTRMAGAGSDVRGPVWIDFPLLLKSNDFKAVIVGFHHVAHQYYKDVRTYSPQSAFIIDSFDLAFVRQRRKAEISGDPRELWRAAEVKRLELTMYRRADMVLTVTEEDRRTLLAEAPDVRVGISTDIHPPGEMPAGAERNGLVFVGNFKHDPNEDAVLYFANEILPSARRLLPGVKFIVVGNAPTDKVTALAGDDVEVTGFVPEVEPYLHRAKVFVVPLRYGAGLKGKIGEALANGIPIVTTSIGAEGMELVHRRNAMIADDPEEFARCIAEVYSDERLWRDLAAEGRKHARRKYSYQAAEQYWLEVFDFIKMGARKSTGKRRDSQVERARAAGFKRLAPLPEIVPNVAVVIPVYNNAAVTASCLASLRKNTMSPHQVVVIDNGSAEDIAYDADQNNYAVIRNPSNMGFAYACNQGIAGTYGDFVVILNNDTIVTPGWLERLLWHMQDDETIAIAGPSTNFASTIQQIKGAYDSEKNLYNFSEDVYRKNQHKALEVEKVVGVCMLVRRRVLEEIGLFDTRYGLGNYEDDDICLRARLAGYKVVWAKDVFIHHRGSKTFETLGLDYSKLMAENSAKYRAKWGAVAEIFGAAPAARAGSPPGTDETAILVMGADRGQAGATLASLGEDTRSAIAIGDGTDLNCESPAAAVLQIAESAKGEIIYFLGPGSVATEGWMKPLGDALAGDQVGCVVSSSNLGVSGQRVKAGYKLLDGELADFARRHRIANRGRIQDIGLGLPVAMAVRRDDLVRHGLACEFRTEAMLMDLERRIAESGMRIVCAAESYIHNGGQDTREARQEREAVLAVERAKSLAEKTAFDAALRLLDQAVALKPDYAEALYERGVLKSLSDAGDQAERDFQEYVKLRPGDSRGYNNLGCTLFSLGKAAEAEATLAKAIEVSSANWEAKKNLADLYLFEGRAHEAMELYLKIVEEHPDCTEIYITIGDMFAAQGDLDTAGQFARIARRLDPGHAGAERMLRSIEVSRAQAKGAGGSGVEARA